MTKDIEVELLGDNACEVVVNYHDEDIDDEHWLPDGHGWYNDDTDESIGSMKEFVAYLEGVISEFNATVDIMDSNYNFVATFN